MKMTTPQLRNSINDSSLGAFLLIPFVLAYFGLSPQVQAVCQEGCLTNKNTVFGEDALLNNTALYNTAIGFQALMSNTAGADNTAVGANALNANTTGDQNTAIGWYALFYNTTGANNTATGYAAMINNTTGVNNTGTGGGALGANTTGSGNTATGHGALPSSTTGDGNTATGVSALFYHTTGNYNTANGAGALSSNTTGNRNIAMGFNAGKRLTVGDDNIDIGNYGASQESGVIRIGTEGTHTATYIAGIRDAPFVHGTAVAVGITADGQLGVRASSVRFKELVKPMDKASEAIFSVQPVTFRYKKDPTALPQFGLVAEDVEKVSPDLVARDEQGKPFTVRYDEINAMLLNEFLKEHKAFVAEQRKVQEQGATIARLEQQIETLTAGLQKVTAQLELSKPEPRMVVNNQ